MIIKYKINIDTQELLRRVFYSLFFSVILIIICLGQFFVVEQIIDFKIPIKLPSFAFHSHSWENGLFSAKGTWALKYSPTNNDSIPINLTEIKCNKENGYCKEIYVWLWDKQLILNQYNNRIISWNSHKIICEYADPQGYGKSILTIERDEKKICRSYIKLKNVSSEKRTIFTPYYDPTQKDILIDGWDLIIKLRNDFIPMNYVLYLCGLYFLIYIYRLKKIWKDTWKQ